MGLIIPFLYLFYKLYIVGSLAKGLNSPVGLLEEIVIN